MKLQQSDLNESIRSIPLPDLMRELPVNRKGFPVPFFADKVNGEWDFRVMSKTNYRRCVKEHLCWICGQRLGSKKAFVAGPMCVVTKTSAEPPCHLSCAQYAAIACPFLAMPKMRRNEKNLPEEIRGPAGFGIMRNPGVTAVLVTRSYKMFGDGDGGALVEMGPPESVEWYAERGRATRKQVLDSIESGLPILVEQCNKEGDAASCEAAHAELAKRLSETMRWVPAEPPPPAPQENPWKEPVAE